MSVILNPVEQYFDLDGEPLQSGYLYFGEVYGNPVTQPTMVYFDPEFTIPAAQPVRTINGFPVRSGTATGIYAPDDVSILVQNQNKEQVIYIQSSAIDTSNTTTIYRDSNIQLNSDDNNRTFIMLNSFTQTFEPAVNLGDRWRVNIINMSTGNITLEPNLSENIDGLSSLQLKPNQILTVYCDGVNLKTTTLISPTVNISSATTLDLRSIRQRIVTLIGTNTINTVQMINGDRIVTIAGGAYRLTNSANLIVQGNADYTASIGDIVTFTSNGLITWVEVSKLDGNAIGAPVTTAASDPTLSTNDRFPVSSDWVKKYSYSILGTEIATNGATTYNISTSVPSDISRIILDFYNVSLNGSADILVQIGSGSFLTSGYVSSSSNISTTSSASNGSNNGFFVKLTTAPATGYFRLTIERINATTWIESHVGQYTNVGTVHGGGGVQLSGALDRVRITTSNGTDLFDSGVVNYYFEK